MKFYYVYILICSDASYYTGITSDLEQRIEQHNSGMHPSSYTSSRKPVKLLWSQAFTEPQQAITFEKKIKKWSRAKKEALINGDYDTLPELSECKNDSHYKKRDSSD